MTQNAIAKTHTIKETGTGDKYNSWEKNGGIKTLNLTGVDFGNAPTVLAYSSWAHGYEGETAGLDSQDIGPDFDTGHYTSGLQPKYFSVDGHTGVGNRQGGTNPDADVDNVRTGFVRIRPPYSERLVAYNFAVPLDKLFSGTTELGTMPIDSVLKMLWESYNALDDPDQADFVAGSWVGNSFSLGGNQASFSQYVQSAFTFGKWNSLLHYKVAGSPDPFVDNGLSEVVHTVPDVGTYINIHDDTPTFGGGAINAAYTHRAMPGWSGSGPQANTLMVHSYYYEAEGPNSRARLELSDSPIYGSTDSNAPSGSGSRIVVPCGINVPNTTWTNTNITALSDSKQREGRPYYHLTRADGTRTSGVAEWL